MTQGTERLFLKIKANKLFSKEKHLILYIKIKDFSIFLYKVLLSREINNVFKKPRPFSHLNVISEGELLRRKALITLKVHRH